ncbi:hypothetical protein HG530_003418 [Fusarium avenaceum]|nr:hypothetical protein HG530_003418 [Fusarium avenaceum]
MSTFTSASSNRSRSVASARAVMACDSTFILPWNGDLLKKLVWRDVGLESPGIPDFANENTASLDKLCLIGKVLEKKKVPQRGYMRKGLYHDVEVIVVFDIIHSHKPRNILLSVQGVACAAQAIHFNNLLLSVSRIRHIFDIIERATLDLIALWKDINALSFEVDVDVVILVE